MAGNTREKKMAGNTRKKKRKKNGGKHEIKKKAGNTKHNPDWQKNFHTHKRKERVKKKA